MKKFFLIIAFSVIGTTFCNSASAQETAGDLRPYIRLDFGFSIGETKFDKTGADKNSIAEIGGLYNTAVGVETGRSRFEIAYQERDSVSELISTMLGVNSSFNAFAFMGNAFYDYVRSEHFAMYVGAGAGADRYHWQTSIWGNKENGRGWSFIGGLYTGMSFVWTNVAWDLGIDYYYIGEPETNSIVPKTGFRIRF